MKNNSYTETITVNASAQEAFKSINNVTKWWTKDVNGKSHKLNDEFSVQFGDVHYSKQKLTEFVHGKKVVWLVTESKLNFISDKQEWTGTKIVFDIFEKDGNTQVRFTHEGLSPNIECYNDCSAAWGGYITGSLMPLINTGKGNPS